MSNWLARRMPVVLRETLSKVRAKVQRTEFDDLVLRPYKASIDLERRPRLSLVMPHIDARWAFGGVTTGIDLFLELCRQTGADARIITQTTADPDVVSRRAQKFGVIPELQEYAGDDVDPRAVPVRASDIFVTFNWWTTLNIRPLIEEQERRFGGPARPYLYLIQDYEPQFYGFSSTHMLARLALDTGRPCWGIFNSSLLAEYVKAQGHHLARSFVFEPQISDGLRPALKAGPPEKRKRILVYGRPTIPRNCFTALRRGLESWAQRYPQYRDWEVVSAGLAHKPVPISEGRAITSLGKLSLDAYAEMLRSSAVGVSLMSSPHPSYPPLEMAHFGLLTITNSYANKDLSAFHDNIISVPDIDAATIGDALAAACARFEAAPDAGWTAESRMPGYLAGDQWSFLGAVAQELKLAWAEILKDEVK
jgi:hypothetical protein